MHKKNVSLAILVNGKSLYENKNQVYIPYGTNYEIFAKNNNNFDVYITVRRSSLVNSDTFLIKAKSKRVIKGFSENGVFYGFRFVEHIKSMKDKEFNFVHKNRFTITIQKQNPLYDSTKILRDQQISPLTIQGMPQVLINNNPKKRTQMFDNENPITRTFFSDANDVDLTDVDYNNVRPTFDSNLNVLTKGSDENKKCSFMNSNTMEQSFKEEMCDADPETFMNKNSMAITNSIKPEDLERVANQQKERRITKDSEKKSTGTHTYGAPVDEKSDLEHDFNLEKLDEVFFEFEGLDEYGNRLTKPLFSKDHVNCQVCDKKSSPSDTYCTDCGSYIIKTANLIDDEASSELIKNECCGKIYPTEYKYCPICQTELVK